jgi:predicted hydrocarbon binding protein
MADKSDYAVAEQLLLKNVLAGNKAVGNRSKLGPMVPIQLFQALRLIGMGASMENMVGDGARAIVYQSGNRMGSVIGNAVAPMANKDINKYLELVRHLCQTLSIGLVVPETMDLSEGKLTLRVDECVSCAGISGCVAPICNFEAGLVGGIVKGFAGREVKAVETRCNAVGDATCGIDVQILGL